MKLLRSLLAAVTLLAPSFVDDVALAQRSRTRSTPPARTAPAERASEERAAPAEANPPPPPERPAPAAERPQPTERASRPSRGDSSETADATPTNYVDRPITLRRRTLRVDAAPGDFGLFDSGAILGPVGDRGAYGFRIGQSLDHIHDPFLGAAVTAKSTFGGIGLGAAYGIGNGFEVGAMVLPLRFDGTNAFGNVTVYGRGRLTSGDVSSALQVAVSTPTGNDLGVSVGVPINVHVHDHIRLETGIAAETFYDVENDPNEHFFSINANVPFAATWQLGEAAFLGARTGFVMTDIGTGNRKNDVYIPVGAHGGYSMHVGPMLLDMKLSAQYTFIVEGIANERFSSWVVMLGANAYFDL